MTSGDEARHTGQIVGHGVMSRSAARRDGGIPLGEERADPQTRRIIGQKIGEAPRERGGPGASPRER
jgi:hypothetical protein